MAKVVVRRWPLTLTLPLGASLAMFLVALATTQIALILQEDREIRALESKAAIFLDALADGIALSLERGPDAARELLAGKLRVREALADEGLGLRWIDGAGELHILTPGDGDDPDIADLLRILWAEPPDTFRFTIADDGSRALAGRHYDVDQGTLLVAAALDTAEIHEARAVMERAALIATFLLAGIAALLTYVFTRRALAPLPAIARELADDYDPAGQRAIAVSAEIGPLTEALAARREAEDARSMALLSTSEKERNALIAKLAAGLAHEVRNPLAGLLNAVSTLRRFGGDEQVRRDTLDLIERGLRSISRVADTMLATYRPASGRMHFTREDLDDLQTLV
ncbi:MAG: histidine kinase dimerization/phospho-acceptor domain-containing protein, partial [Salinarimonas sp.]